MKLQGLSDKAIGIISKSFKAQDTGYNENELQEIADEKALDIYAIAADALVSSITKALKQLLNENKQLGLEVYYRIADYLDNKEFGGEMLFSIGEDIEDLL